MITIDAVKIEPGKTHDWTTAVRVTGDDMTGAAIKARNKLCLHGRLGAFEKVGSSQWRISVGRDDAIMVVTVEQPSEDT